VVVVVGDVNSTLACALVAAKAGVCVAHVEAGLRSFDRSMPEEINRVVTDHVSDLLFTTEESAGVNLRREGVPAERIYFVGNVMIDTLLEHRARARARFNPRCFGLDGERYVVLTLHRPSNVDCPAVFEALMGAVSVVAQDLPVVFPVHPRTKEVVERSACASAAVERGRLHLVEPLGYLEFLGLMDCAFAVLTDSGGIQEETTVLGVPCLTLRTSTERPVTVAEGTNRVVGTQPEAILAAWRSLRLVGRQSKVPKLWDGRAATRIVEVFRNWGALHGGTTDPLHPAATADPPGRRSSKQPGSTTG
jgi:UDP-N-acetylglucosamine 2-epimerase (non-hydrolysing)